MSLLSSTIYTIVVQCANYLQPFGYVISADNFGITDVVLCQVRTVSGSGTDLLYLSHYMTPVHVLFLDKLCHICIV